MALVKRPRQESLGKPFTRLFSASLASNVADGVFKTAAPLLAATLTNDPFVISLMAALVMLPWLLFAIPIGGLVDRLDRRLTLATSNAVRFILAAFLAATIATDQVNIPILYAVAFLMGIAEVAYDTSSQSLIPQLLKPQHLERGNARLEVGAITTGEFIGAPISGLLYAAAIALPFIWGAFGIGVASVLLFMIPGQVRTDLKLGRQLQQGKVAPGFWQEIRFGIQYLYEDKVLLKLVLFTAFIGFWFAASTSTWVLFMLNVMKVDPAWYGLFLTIPAVGSVLGSLIVPKVSNRFGRTNVMAAAIISSGVLTLLFGLAPNLWVLSIIGVLQGIAITFWNVLLMSTYHQIIPNHLFGRIHGTRRTLVWGMMPVGALVGGALAVIDLRLPFFVAGIVCTVTAIIGVPFVKRLSNLLPVAEEPHPA